MKRKYRVGVREVHLRWYSVEAGNEDEARELVHQRREDVEDIGFEEFSHELGRETWSVELDRTESPGD